MVGEKLANQLCRRFARRILVALREEEESHHRKVLEEPRWSGKRAAFTENMPETYRLVLDMIREWCGQDAVEDYDEVTGLREEIRRLRGLIESTSEWLRNAGHPVKAAALLKEVSIKPKKPRQRG